MVISYHLTNILRPYIIIFNTKQLRNHILLTKFNVPVLQHFISMFFLMFIYRNIYPRYNKYCVDNNASCYQRVTDPFITCTQSRTQFQTR